MMSAIFNIVIISMSISLPLIMSPLSGPLSMCWQMLDSMRHPCHFLIISIPMMGKLGSK